MISGDRFCGLVCRVLQVLLSVRLLARTADRLSSLATVNSWDPSCDHQWHHSSTTVGHLSLDVVSLMSQQKKMLLFITELWLALCNATVAETGL